MGGGKMDTSMSYRPEPLRTTTPVGTRTPMMTQGQPKPKEPQAVLRRAKRLDAGVDIKNAPSLRIIHDPARTARLQAGSSLLWPSVFKEGVQNRNNSTRLFKNPNMAWLYDLMVLFIQRNVLHSGAGEFEPGDFAYLGIMGIDATKKGEILFQNRMAPGETQEDYNGKVVVLSFLGNKWHAGKPGIGFAWLEDGQIEVWPGRPDLEKPAVVMAINAYHQVLTDKTSSTKSPGVRVWRKNSKLESSPMFVPYLLLLRAVRDFRTVQQLLSPSEHVGFTHGKALRVSVRLGQAIAECSKSSADARLRALDVGMAKDDDGGEKPVPFRLTANMIPSFSEAFLGCELPKKTLKWLATDKLLPDEKTDRTLWQELQDTEQAQMRAFLGGRLEPSFFFNVKKSEGSKGTAAGLSSQSFRLHSLHSHPLGLTSSMTRRGGKGGGEKEKETDPLAELGLPPPVRRKDRRQRRKKRQETADDRLEALARQLAGDDAELQAGEEEEAADMPALEPLPVARGRGGRKKAGKKARKKAVAAPKRAGRRRRKQPSMSASMSYDSYE